MTDQSPGAEPRRGSDKQGASELDLEAIEGRAREATPGPWEIVPYGDGDSLVIHDGPDQRVCFMATPGSSPGAMARIEANATFIAHARTDLPALIEEVKRSGDREARLEHALRNLIADCQIMAWDEAKEIGTDSILSLLPKWEGIESAPRDGTRVLIATRFSTRLDDDDSKELTSPWRYAVAWWDNQFHADWDEAAGDTAYRGAWTAGRVADWGMEEAFEETPTHWMPLPSPPGEEK